jgi:tetratricopeptide (TPR) repeat protein
VSSGSDSDGPDSILEIGGLRVAPGDRIAGYVYRRLVGKGGMAHVLLASDPDGRPVALKVLKSSRVGSGRTRFKREFRALARLRHPNVIRVDAFGDLHGHPFIAMEYVEGHDLHHAIQIFRTLPPDERWRRCEEILVDLCRALAYIHRRGLIHRDLKPSNILLDHDRHCKLTDFGIVKDLDPDADSAVSTTLVGTWAYASPEQITGQPIDHRSDLYSLGVILFAMLTGRRPFVARDLSGYLELHRSHVAPAPRELDPTVPVHLDEICRKLLRKQPRDRFRSAQEILYRLEQLDADNDGADIAAWTAPLAGRAAEEEVLRGRTAALTRGQSGLLLIEGEEGTGKTRMLEVAANQAELMGIPVHRVRAAERDGPFSPVLRLAASVGGHLGARAPARLGEAVAAFSEEGASRGQARERLYDALVEAVTLLLDEGPQVLLVDDLQNAQLPTLDALSWLLRRFASGDGHALLVVGTLRPDRVTPRLAALREPVTAEIVPEILRLKPLPRDAVDDLVLGLLGPGRPAMVLAERLFRETEGNPLFLVAYVQNLITHGLITRSTGGWRLVADIDEIASGHFEVPAAVRNAVRARLDTLDERERPLAEALAVNGREIEVDVLLDVLDLDEEGGADRVEALLAQGIVRQRGAGQQTFLEFVHTKYGDVIYRELDPEHRADTHRRIAAALEVRYQHAPAAAEVVGEHYRRAGEAGKAFHYLTAAARRLRDKSQHAEAWDLTGRAQLVDDAARVDLAPQEYAAIKHHLLQVRADVLYHRSEWGEAREVLEQALTLLTAGVDEASGLRTRIHYARALRVTGDLDRAAAEVASCLERARDLHDRAAVSEGLLVLAGIAWARGELDACERNAQEGLVLATGPTLVGARAHLLLALTAVQASRGELASAASGLNDAQALFRDLRMRPARALALANLAEVLLGQGDPGGAWENATDALQEAEEAGHRLGESAAHGIRGLAALRAGAREVARTELEASLAAARALGVQSELAVPAWQLARLDLEEGEPEVALVTVGTAATAARLGDPEHYGPAIEALRAQALARTDEPAAARAVIATVDGQLGGLPMLRRAQVMLDLARAVALLGDAAPALVRAREVWHLCSVRGFRLFALDGLLLMESLVDDVAERTRIRADLRTQAREVAATLPSDWQIPFLRRMGLAA